MSRRARAVRAAAVTGVIASLLVAPTGCVAPAPAAPAELRQTPPPWTAPRDAVSYITAAGMEPQPLGMAGGAQIVRLTITVDAQPVTVPAYVGIDRPRAVQADVHTHDESGELWLEGKAAATVTLGQFFTVWGVRLDRSCLGAACGGLTVTVDRRRWSDDPATLPLARARSIAITARS